jgi:peptidoglycan-N-acetylglucosamine deacetylase
MTTITTTSEQDAPAATADGPDGDGLPAYAPSPGPSRAGAVRRRFRRLATVAGVLAVVAILLAVLLVREVVDADGGPRTAVLMGERVATDARVIELEGELADLQAQIAAQGQQLGDARSQLEQLAPAPPAAPAPAPSASVPAEFAPGPMQVALTFDDGPDPTTTPSMLETLDRLGIKATFFLLGQNAERHPDLVTAVARGGHGIGNHSWSHPDFTKLSGEQLRVEQLGRTNDAIVKAGVPAPRCFRPPMGRTNDAVVAEASAVGLTQMKWNVDPSDYLQQAPVDLAARVVNDVKALGPDRGSVVVMHDSGPQGPNTVAAIPEIVGQLKAAGYTFVAIC